MDKFVVLILVVCQYFSCILTENATISPLISVSSTSENISPLISVSSTSETISPLISVSSTSESNTSTNDTSDGNDTSETNGTDSTPDYDYVLKSIILELANMSSTSTTEPPENENEEAKIEETPWLKYSELLFRKVDKLPNDNLSLFGVKCDPELYKSYSPVYTLAYPDISSDTATNKKTTILRHDILQAFRIKPIGSKTPILRTVWQNILNDKTSVTDMDEAKLLEDVYEGRAFEAAICYSDGNELLECKDERCVCPSSGNLAKLRMVRTKKSQVSDSVACMAMDCGYCLMKSSATYCALYGVCRESAVTREWRVNFPQVA